MRVTKDIEEFRNSSFTDLYLRSRKSCVNKATERPRKKKNFKASYQDYTSDDTIQQFHDGFPIEIGTPCIQAHDSVLFDA